jgi:hypothetical protein
MNIALPLDDSSRARIGAPSKAMFNSEYVLEALAFMAREPRFYAGAIAEATGCERNYAGQILKRLLDARAIELTETEDGQQRKYYKRIECPLWELSVAWLAYLLEAPETGVAHLVLTPS